MSKLREWHHLPAKWEVRDNPGLQQTHWDTSKKMSAMSLKLTAFDSSSLSLPSFHPESAAVEKHYQLSCHSSTHHPCLELVPPWKSLLFASQIRLKLQVCGGNVSREGLIFKDSTSDSKSITDYCYYLLRAHQGHLSNLLCCTSQTLSASLPSWGYKQIKMLYKKIKMSINTRYSTATLQPMCHLNPSMGKEVLASSSSTK